MELGLLLLNGAVRCGAVRAGADLLTNQESFSFLFFFHKIKTQSTARQSSRHIQTLDSNKGRAKAALTVERAIILCKEHTASDVTDVAP